VDINFAQGGYLLLACNTGAFNLYSGDLKELQMTQPVINMPGTKAENQKKDEYGHSSHNE
jgi:hypothetical protein